MADANSVIWLTTGAAITVAMGLDDLNRQLTGYDTPGVAPFMKVTDIDGDLHLINVGEIVVIEGAE